MKPPHQESLLSEVEFERLLNAAASTHSFETLSETIVYARGPACQPTQYLRIVSMMYHKLDANKIPYRIINDDGVTINELSEALDFAFTSLIGLGTTMRIWLTKVNQQDFRQQLAKGLRAHWPEIRQWVLFLYRSIIVQDDLDIDLRHICKKAVLEFLGLIRDDRLRVWSKSVPTDREVMKVISDLWFLEIRDPRFSSWDSMVINQRESAVFGTCLLMAFELGVSIDWENILSVFLRDPELIAKVSLCHLEGEISHGDELDLFCITCDLQIISVLSQLENIRLALMRQGVVKAAAEILALIVGREWKGEMQVFASRCMITATALLRSRIEEMDALPFLSQALERGLVASLLKCEATLTSAVQPSARREPILLLAEVLPGYSVYRSVLHQLALAVDSAVGQRLDAKLSKSGEFCKAWKQLRDTVDERRKLVRRDVSSGHVQTCQNDMCSKTSHMGRFKRCGGCLHAYYCSWKCQRYDWQNGKHKQYCTRVQQRFIRTYGQMSPIHSKNLKFLDQVILAELKKHRERLSAQPSKLTLVELNLVGGEVGMVFDARGANANPFGTKCKCESYSNARWKRMAEVLREGKKPMVLVRAFIPGGVSRKIVLQAIPLAMVVEDQRRNGQVMEKHQFNLIFTCCGSEGSDRSVILESTGVDDIKLPTTG
ncbi:hypothetical protein EV363DRAFT_1349158 [Boletus edulis]|nr:hypothetical protein EV363DRAFT_1349158 [Boletus edulis]